MWLPKSAVLPSTELTNEAKSIYMKKGSSLWID
jgi:hypothetical protein